MEASRREMFSKYFDNLCNQRGAFSLQDKLSLLDELQQNALERGAVPIALDQIAYVKPDSPRVKAIQAGENVSVGGTSIQSRQTWQERLAALPIGPRLLVMVLIFFGPLIILLGVGQLISAGQSEPTATMTLTPLATGTLLPSSTPEPQFQAPTATSYAMILATAKVPTGVNDPVSVEFGGVAFVLYESSLDAGEWNPAVAEWLEGTELRRVLAVPYNTESGNAVAAMKFDDPIKLRLGSGEVVEYRLVEIKRIKRLEIEVLNVLEPSLVIVLYGERSTERYVLVARAVQPEMDVYGNTATPTLTPTPAVSPTPAFDFVPPVTVNMVVTESLTVTNETAGLQLTVGACDRVAQIGTREGRFMLCDVTLTALSDNAQYSGQTLAIAEYSQVVSAADWWPPTLSVVGAIGDGRLALVGDTVVGKVAGEVKKSGSGSDPVLLWEQAGIRYVIYIER